MTEVSLHLCRANLIEIKSGVHSNGLLVLTYLLHKIQHGIGQKVM